MLQTQQEVFVMSDKFVSTLVVEILSYLCEHWDETAGPRQLLTKSESFPRIRCCASIDA